VHFVHAARGEHAQQRDEIDASCGVGQRDRFDRGRPRCVARAGGDDERTAIAQDTSARRSARFAIDDHAERLARCRDIAHGELRIVAQHGADARQDRARPGAIGVAIRACRRSGDPAAFTAPQRRATVETRRELGAQPRPSARHARHEADIERLCFRLKQADVEAHAGALQPRPAAALRRIRIAHRCHHAADAGRKHGIDTGRRPTVAIARLERDVEGGTAHVVAASLRIGKCRHLGMREAGARVEPLADDDAVLRDHTTDARIRRGRIEAALGERERARHLTAVVFGEPVGHAGRRAALRGVRTASTSFNASRKSETSWNER
jgi:hypothetical protein